MKLKNIIDKHDDFIPVGERILELFPDQYKNLQGYEVVFNQLRRIKPVNSNLFIELYRVDSNNQNFWVDTDKPWTGVHGLDTDGISYSLEFSPWAEWLSMEITPLTLGQWDELEILVQCMFEMTFHGFSEEQIAQASDNLQHLLDNEF